MITETLAFIHARRWIVELIIAAAITGAVVWYCTHLVNVGVQKQKDVDARALAEWQHNADLEAGRKQGRADAANEAREKELTDLRKYRAEHPLHGGLCLNRAPSAAVPAVAGALSSDAPADAGGGDLLEVPSGDPRAGGPPDPDVRHLLDVLAGRADILSASLREYKAR
jgi:hypothetical protein